MDDSGNPSTASFRYLVSRGAHRLGFSIFGRFHHFFDLSSWLFFVTSCQFYWQVAATSCLKLENTMILQRKLAKRDPKRWKFPAVNASRLQIARTDRHAPGYRYPAASGKLSGKLACKQSLFQSLFFLFVLAGLVNCVEGAVWAVLYAGSGRHYQSVACTL